MVLRKLVKLLNSQNVNSFINTNFTPKLPSPNFSNVGVFFVLFLFLVFCSNLQACQGCADKNLERLRFRTISNLFCSIFQVCQIQSWIKLVELKFGTKKILNCRFSFRFSSLPRMCGQKFGEVEIPNSRARIKNGEAKLKEIL